MSRRSPRQEKQRRTVRVTRDAVGLREEDGESLSDEENRARNAAIAKQRHMNETRFHETSKAPTMRVTTLGDPVLLERTTGNAEKPWMVSEALRACAEDRHVFKPGDKVHRRLGMQSMDMIAFLFVLEQDGEALISRVVDGKTRWYSVPVEDLVHA